MRFLCVLEVLLRTSASTVIRTVLAAPSPTPDRLGVQGDVPRCGRVCVCVAYGMPVCVCVCVLYVLYKVCVCVSLEGIVDAIKDAFSRSALSGGKEIYGSSRWNEMCCCKVRRKCC